MSNTKPKHTPGPWIVSPDTENLIPVVLSEEGMCIAECDDATPEDKANAQLIASAPELLEQLQLILENNCIKQDGIHSMLVGDIKRLIAKATGGVP